MEALHEELTGAAVSGDQEALAELLTREDPRLRGRLAGKIGSPYRSAFDLDDVLQVTYLEAFLRISAFQPSGDGAFLAWLTRIAENNIRDAIKELEREKRPSPLRRVHAQPDESEYIDLIETLATHSGTPSRKAAAHEAKGAIEHALSQLPPDYATAVRMYDLEGVPARRIAEAVGRSVGAVHMLRARAHDFLAEILGQSTNFFSGSA